MKWTRGEKLNGKKRTWMGLALDADPTVRNGDLRVTPEEAKARAEAHILGAQGELQEIPFVILENVYVYGIRRNREGGFSLLCARDDETFEVELLLMTNGQPLFGENAVGVYGTLKTLDGFLYEYSIKGSD